MRTILRTALVACLPIAPALAQPFPITPLLEEGDSVAGVGLVTSTSSSVVSDLGDWIVEADTDNPNTDADNVLVRNGVLFVREGQLLAAPAGARASSFGSGSINTNADSGWNFFLDGPPGDQDSGVYFNDTLVIQESQSSTAPQLTPGTPYLGFFGGRLNDANQMLVMASIDDPAISGTVDRALVIFQLDPSGAVSSETVVAAEGSTLAGQTETVADFATGANQYAMNAAGQTAFFADLTGSAASDGVVYLDDRIVAQEADDSPVPGRRYELLSSRSLDVNAGGDVFFRANLDGSTADDELLVLEDRVVVREGGSIPAIGAFAFTAFGSNSGPVRVDDNRNLLWYGDWDDPDTDVDTGLFLNELMLVQEGITSIGGLVVDTIANSTEAFTMSDNGRWVVFEATLADGTEGVYGIQIQAPPPVPDGGPIAGAPMLAGRGPGGDVDVLWDSSSCPGDDYHLFYGALADVSSYGYSGESCDLGTAGTATVALPAGNLFWVVAAVDAAGIEGTHGLDGAGDVRLADADGACSVQAQINGATCGP